MRKVLILSVSLLSLMFLSSCGGNSGSLSDFEFVPGSETITITSTGGKINLDGFLAEFAPGVLPVGTTVSGSISPDADAKQVLDFCVADSLVQATESNVLSVNIGQQNVSGQVSVKVRVPKSLNSAMATGDSLAVFALTDSVTSDHLEETARPVDFVEEQGVLSLQLNPDDFAGYLSTDGTFEANLYICAIASDVIRAEDVMTFIGSPLAANPPVQKDAFNPARGHNGADYKANTPDAILAVDDGQVIANDVQVRPCLPKEQRCIDLGLSVRGAGHYVKIKHTNKRQSKYFHLVGDKNVGPAVGSIVTEGQQIGTADSTGGVTGPHLHFEYLKSTTSQFFVNPSLFIKPQYDLWILYTFYVADGSGIAKAEGWPLGANPIRVHESKKLSFTVNYTGTLGQAFYDAQPPLPVVRLYRGNTFTPETLLYTFSTKLNQGSNTFTFSMTCPSSSFVPPNNTPFNLQDWNGKVATSTGK